MRNFLNFVTVLMLLSAIIIANTVKANSSNLLDELVSPPKQYGPYVWWHWSNGNINQEEAIKDIEWFAEIGIAGVQLFEAGLGIPANDRVIYGSELWRNAVKASASRAQALNVKFAITTSPGWSAAGGPWVPLQDGMKKLAWSEVQITGGSKIDINLPAQITTGPFQDIPIAWSEQQDNSKQFYQDLKVLAVKHPYTALMPSKINLNSQPVSDNQLIDGKLWPAYNVSKDEHGTSYIDVFFASDVEISGISLGLPGRRGFGAPAQPRATLYYEKNGQYVFVADLAISSAMTRTLNFDTVKAKTFRIELFTNNAHSADRRYGIGVNKLPFKTSEDHHSISEITFF